MTFIFLMQCSYKQFSIYRMAAYFLTGASFWKHMASKNGKGQTILDFLGLK